MIGAPGSCDPPFDRLAALVEAQGAAALVSILAVEGSSPREPGARLIVAPDGRFCGTIGGGALEHSAIGAAAEAFARAPGDRLDLTSVALGPELGQCCGGRVRLAREIFTRARLDELRCLAAVAAGGLLVTRAAIAADGRVGPREVLPPGAADAAAAPSLAGGVLVERFGEEAIALLLFGAGHVGRALMLALAPLPVRVSLVDNRPDLLALPLPSTVSPLYLQDPVAAFAACRPGTEVLVMTHDHGLDFRIADAGLRHPGALQVGMIGSTTKAARMRSRLRSAGHGEAALARFRCPVGLPGIAGKAPAVIAAGIAAELLLRASARAAAETGASAADGGSEQRLRRA